jgi:hypothetical protein
MLVNFVGNDEQIEFLRDFGDASSSVCVITLPARIGGRADDNRF